jgi:acyl-CoA thioester hydrolase
MEYRRKIFGYECDIYGHLNNANYLHLFEEARADALEQMKLPVRDLAKVGFHIYITNIEIQFKKGLPLESVFTIKSSIDKANRLTSVWIQEIFDASGDLCSIAIVKGAFVKDGKPTRISKELFAVFENNMEK